MNNVQILKQIIENRKSTFPKDYSGEDIPNDILNEILNSANFAPNHKKTKPWRFQVFQKEDKIKLAQELQRIYKLSTPEQSFLEKKHQDIFNKIMISGAVLTISVNFSGLVPEWEEIAATSMAVQNMYLMSTANTVGCYWSSPTFTENLSQFLNLHQNQKCIGLFYMGMLEK